MNNLNIEIDATEISKEAYKDGVKPVLSGLGDICDTVLGFVDKVVLFPLKKLSATFEYKAQVFKSELEKKISQIPAEKICEPDLSIVGPSLEVLKYNLDNDNIRIMFENLISNNVNSDYKNKTHPRFVEIIKQMNSLDAVIFSKLFNAHFIPILQQPVNGIGVPHFMSELKIPETDFFQISASLENLCHLGLINFDAMSHYSDSFYSEMLKKTTELEQKNGLFVECCSIRGVMYITDFGLNFASVCLNLRR